MSFIKNMSEYVTVEIESLAGKTGYGVAHSDHKTIFIPFAFPGDEVVVEKKNKKKWYISQVIEFKEKSEYRIKSVCPVHPDFFNKESRYCGGCPWLTLSYEKQTEAKLDILKRAFRQSKVELLLPSEIKKLENPYGYRYRARFSYDGKKLGYKQFHSNELIEIETCPVLKFSSDLKLIKDILPEKGKGEVRILWNEKGEMHVFFDKKHVNLNKIKVDFNKIKGVIVGNKVKGDKFLTFYSDNSPLYVSAGGFFQAGFESNELIVNALNKVFEQLEDVSEVVEFHAGAGNLTRILKEKFNVTCIESDPNSWDAFELGFSNTENVKLLKIKDSEFGFSSSKTNFVVLDPPRSGLSKIFTDKLINAEPKYIVLISCDPMSAMRDLSNLVSAGYKHIFIEMADTMPSTPHFELISLLVNGK